MAEEKLTVKIMESNQITGEIKLGSNTVVTMTANINSENTAIYNYTEAINNNDSYLANLEECRTKLDGFRQSLRVEEDRIISKYAPIVEPEVPVEVIPEDLPTN